MTAVHEAPPRRARRLWLLGLLVTLLLAAVVSAYASSSPDGLERVAEDEGFVATAEDHALSGSPLADYEVDDVDDDRLAVGAAGAAGVAVTLGAAGGLLWLLRRNRP